MNISDAAKYFLNLNDYDAGSSITNLKLQKLCYYAEAYSLALKDRPLFEGVEFEAWRHGPVQKELYDEYREYKWHTISPPKDKAHVDEEDKEILDLVWNKFGIYDAKFLEKLSHSETPWIKARGELDEEDRCNCPISKEEMKFYHKHKLYIQKRNSYNYKPKYSLEELVGNITPENQHPLTDILNDTNIEGELL